MSTYYVFLRGINVGGHKKVPMADLKALLTSMGYDKVGTVLNSGNVRLDAPELETIALENILDETLEKEFGFKVPVLVRPASRIGHLLQENPFAREKQDKQIKWMVTLFREPVQNHPGNPAPQGVNIQHRAPDLLCTTMDLQVSGSPDLMKWLEGVYGKDITTRTWQTLEKLNSL